jgi:hypothetical protein
VNLDEGGARSEPQPNANAAETSSDPPESSILIHERDQLDVWLQRLSYLSQIGLFIFTAWALYFTVIPLYQKALLDEAIAKKEIELKEATAELEKAYGRIKFSVLKDFVFMAGARCSDLKYREPLHGKPLPPFAELFELDVPACLIRTAEEYTPLVILKPEDRKLFDESLLVLSRELLNIWQLAKAEYDEVPKRAAADPSALPSPREVRGEALKVIAKLVSPEVYQQYVLMFTIEEEQSRIGGSYGDAIRQRVLTLLPKK